MEYNELYHHGILGQKWGIRRFQNKDGSLTASGRKRYGNESSSTSDKVRAINANARAQLKSIKRQNKEAARIAAAEAKANAKIAKAEAKNKSKSDSTSEKQKNVRDMTDDEIRARINRIQLENQLKSLTPQKTSKGKNFVTSVMTKVVAPAAADAGKNLLKSYLDKKGKEILGLDTKTIDPSQALSKEVKDLTMRKQLNELHKYFENEKKNQNANKTNSSNNANASTNNSNNSNNNSNNDNTKASTNNNDNTKASTNSSNNSRPSGNKRPTSNNDVTVEPGSYKSRANKSRRNRDVVIDVDNYTETPYGQVSSSPYTSSGRSYVSQLSSTPISALPPASTLALPYRT